MLKIKGNCYSEVVTPGYVKLANISDYLKSCEHFFHKTVQHKLSEDNACSQLRAQYVVYPTITELGATSSM